MPLKKALENHFKQAVTFIKKFAKNTPNVTACSHIIELENQQRYIVHQQSERATSLGIDYQLELQILQKIAPLNLAPQVIYSTQEYILLSYIEGKNPHQYSDLLLTKLAEQLATLHQFDFSVLSHLTTFNIVERCHFLYLQLSLAQQKKFDLSTIQSIKPFSLGICHHDLHLANFVEQNNQLYLIDWEYSAISDPALEIALFFYSNKLTKKQQKFFLNYFLSLTKFDSSKFLNKIEEYQEVIKLLNQLWSEVQTNFIIN